MEDGVQRRVRVEVGGLGQGGGKGVEADGR